MKNLMLNPKLAAAGVAAAVAIAPAVALAATSWQISMAAGAAYPKANGAAQYQSRSGQRDLQVEVQHVRALAGQKVVFSAAGKTLGSAKVSALGQADITRNTELRQAVPSIARGSAVTVRTAAGQMIVSGQF